MSMPPMKFVAITPPAAIKDNASWTTAEIDTLGWKRCLIVTHLGATDIAAAALTVTESDTSGSGHANVTGAIWGTSDNIDGSTSALPSASDDDTFQVCDLDLRARKRYLDVTATAGDGTSGTYATIFAILLEPEIAPTTATEYGCDEVLRP